MTKILLLAAVVFVAAGCTREYVGAYPWPYKDGCIEVRDDYTTNNGTIVASGIYCKVEKVTVQ